MDREPLSIETILRKDIQESQREKDQVRLDTLRMALHAIHSVEVERTDRKNVDFGKPLTEDDGIKVLNQEIKKRRQAIESFTQAGRQALAEKEQRELEILQHYVQASQLSEEQIHTVVQDLVVTHGKNFQAVIRYAIEATKGQAEGATVQKVVRELTQ